MRIKRFWIVDEIFKETFYQQSICLICMFTSNMLIHLLSVVNAMVSMYQ